MEPILGKMAFLAITTHLLKLERKRGCKDICLISQRSCFEESAGRIHLRSSIKLGLDDAKVEM